MVTVCCKLGCMVALYKCNGSCKDHCADSHISLHAEKSASYHHNLCKFPLFISLPFLFPSVKSDLYNDFPYVTSKQYSYLMYAIYSTTNRSESFVCSMTKSWRNC